MLPDDWRDLPEYRAWHRAVEKRWAPICEALWGDPEACFGCGRREWVEIHHEYPAEFYPHLVYHPENGAPACRPPGGRGCHNKIDPQLYAAGRDPWEKELQARAKRRRHYVGRGLVLLEAAAVWCVFGNPAAPLLFPELMAILPTATPREVLAVAGLVTALASLVVVELGRLGWVLVRRVR